MNRSAPISAKSGRLRRVLPLVAAFRRSRLGSVAIELALLAPVLAGFLIGAVDFGSYIYKSMQMQSASRAGAQYAIQTGANSTDSTGISDAVFRSSTDLDPGLSVVSATFCACADGSSSAVSNTTGCGGTCPGGDTPALTVQVTVSNTFKTIFPYPGIPDSIVITGKTALRVP